MDQDFKWRHVAPYTTKEWRRMIDAAERRWRAGESVCKLMCALRLQSTLMAYEGRVPLDMEWTDSLLDSASWVCDPFIRILRWANSTGVEADLGLHTALAWSMLQTLQFSDTPPWFTLSEALTCALLGTHLRGVQARDVVMPYPGLYLELPPGVLWVHHDRTGMHEARVICLAEGSPSERSALVTTRLATRNMTLTMDELRALPGFHDRAPCVFGRRVLIMMYCEPNARSTTPEDDMITYCSLPLHSGQATIDAMLALDDETTGLDPHGHELGGELLGNPLTMEELRKLLRSLTVNVLLYLAAPGADRVHAHAERIRALKKGKNRKSRRVREQIQRLQAQPEWHLGSRVRVVPGLRESVSRAGTQSGRAVATNILVRGHWRHQWYGPKTADNPRGQGQRWVWIRPQVRNPAPGKVFGHEYLVAE